MFVSCIENLARLGKMKIKAWARARIVELENILLPESVCKLTMMTVGCRP